MEEQERKYKRGNKINTKKKQKRNTERTKLKKGEYKVRELRVQIKIIRNQERNNTQTNEDIVRIHAYAVAHDFDSLSFGCLSPQYLLCVLKKYIYKAVDGTDLLQYRDNMRAFVNTVINFVFHKTRKLM